MVALCGLGVIVAALCDTIRVVDVYHFGFQDSRGRWCGTVHVSFCVAVNVFDSAGRQHSEERSYMIWCLLVSAY